MKPRVYIVLLLLVVPLQAAVLEPLAIRGVRPDIGLALLYCIGLLTGPLEAALAGIAFGLVQDIGSASLIGLTAFTRGLIGLFASLLGRHMLDHRSPSNILFLTAFSFAEGLFILLLLQIFHHSSVPARVLFGHMLPSAVYTAVLGYGMLGLVTRRRVRQALQRQGLGRE